MIKFVFVILALVAFTGAYQKPHPRFGERIAGGHEVNIKEYSYQLSLEDGGVHICGASIIDSKWALTSASCVSDLSISSVTLRANSARKESGGNVHQASNIIVHPDYNRFTHDWDYAVVEVKEPFLIGPQDLTAVKLAIDDPTPGTLVTISGWGGNGGSSQRLLQAADVQILGRGECDYYGQTTSQMICTIGNGFCTQDIGGPLVNRRTGEQVGIMSVGDSCNEAKPGIYANVAVAENWIKRTTGISY